MSATSKALRHSEVSADVEWVEEKCLAVLKDYGERIRFPSGPSVGNLVETGERLLKLSEWTLAKKKDLDGSRRFWVKKYKVRVV